MAKLLVLLELLPIMIDIYNLYNFIYRKFHCVEFGHFYVSHFIRKQLYLSTWNFIY